MNLGGGDRRRISILQGRNRLKGAQNNILRLKGLSLVSLRKKPEKNRKNFYFFLWKGGEMN